MRVLQLVYEDFLLFPFQLQCLVCPSAFFDLTLHLLCSTMQVAIDLLVVAQRRFELLCAAAHLLLEHDGSLEQTEIRTLRTHATLGTIHQCLDHLVQADDLGP